MTDDHVHGPGCTSQRVIGPFHSRPVFTLVLTEVDLATQSSGYIETDLPMDLVPRLLRALADKVERANKAKLS